MPAENPCLGLEETLSQYELAFTAAEEASRMSYGDFMKTPQGMQMWANVLGAARQVKKCYEQNPQLEARDLLHYKFERLDEIDAKN